MPLWILNSFIFIPELHLLIWLPLYSVLMEDFFQLQKCMKYVPKLMRFFYNAVSNLVGNVSHILSYLLDSASRQCCESWALQFPFIHDFKDILPPSGLAFMVALTGSLLRLSNNLPMACSSLQHLLEMGKPDIKPGFGLMFKIMPLPDSSGGPLAKKPHLETRIGNHQESRKSSGFASGSSINSIGRRVAMGMAFLMCCSLQLYWHHLLSLCMLVHVPRF